MSNIQKSIEKFIVAKDNLEENYEKINKIFSKEEIFKDKNQVKALSQITIPPSVTSIGDYEFAECFSLTQVTIPSSVTKIENYAFSECSSLTQITIPSSVISIGYNTFKGCSSLT